MWPPVHTELLALDLILNFGGLNIQMCWKFNYSGVFVVYNITGCVLYVVSTIVIINLVLSSGLRKINVRDFPRFFPMLIVFLVQNYRSPF